MQLDGGKLLKAKYLKVVLLDLGQVHVGASQWLKFLHPSRTPCMYSTHEVGHCNAPIRHKNGPKDHLKDRHKGTAIQAADVCGSLHNTKQVLLDYL